MVSELFDFEPVAYEMEVMSGMLGRKVVFFEGLFTIKGSVTQFSAPGDSGSIITFLDDEKKRWGVGIVVAGDNKGLTLALSLDRILKYFGVTLVDGHNS